MVNTANGAGPKGKKGKCLKERRQRLYKLKFKVKGIKQLVHAVKRVIVGVLL